jgi:soluble lytic murein transglycosylase-like protein
VAPIHANGAHPRRAEPTGSSSTGSSPRLDADTRARSQQLAATFAAQVQASMLESLTQLGSAGEPEDGGEGGEDAGAEGGDATAGLDDGFQQLTLMSSLFSGAQARGRTPAQLQAQLSALGTSGALGAAGAGAGDEAQLAQQLLATLGGAASTGESGAVDAAAAPSGSAAANARVVAQVAREQGVDPTVAVAMMLVESGGRANAVGDGGTSFGLFQLHEGGMLTAAGLSSTQAFDPRTNAAVALKSYAHEWSKGHARRSPGEIAAASQRPADPVGYAAKVDAAMDRARALLVT